MSLLMQHLLHPYLAPAGEAGGGGGGAEAVLDRGDDFTPTDDAAAPAKKEEPKPEAKKEEPKPEAKTGDEDGKDELTDEERKQAKYVPRHRLNEVVQKSKAKEEAYQAEIAKLRQQVESNKVDENIEKLDENLAKLEDQYDDHMMEGEKDKAKAVRAEIRKLTAARQQMVSYAYSAQAQIAAIEQYRYDNALDTLEAQYPQLNEQNDEFSSEVTQEIADLMAVYQQRGMSKAESLKRAVTARLGPPPVKEEGEKPSGSALKEERTQEARKKALDTVQKQPPDISKVGEDSDKRGGAAPQGKDLAKMPFEKFAKLDDDTLAKLRGDDFEG